MTLGLTRIKLRVAGFQNARIVLVPQPLLPALGPTLLLRAARRPARPASSLLRPPRRRAPRPPRFLPGVRLCLPHPSRLPAVFLRARRGSRRSACRLSPARLPSLGAAASPQAPDTPGPTAQPLPRGNAHIRSSRSHSRSKARRFYLQVHLFPRWPSSSLAQGAQEQLSGSGVVARPPAETLRLLESSASPPARAPPARQQVRTEADASPAPEPLTQPQQRARAGVRAQGAWAGPRERKPARGEERHARGHPFPAGPRL